MKTKKININFFTHGKSMTQITKLFNGDEWRANTFQNESLSKKILVFKQDAKFYINEIQPANKGINLIIDDLGHIEIKQN